jgi:prevent-host-death family protein
MTRKSRPQKNARKPVSLLMLGNRTIAASDFKASCLEIMDEVERTGAEVTITKHRKPVVRLVPAKAETRGFAAGMQGLVTHMGDLVSPIDVEWTVDEDHLA